MSSDTEKQSTDEMTDGTSGAETVETPNLSEDAHSDAEASDVTAHAEEVSAESTDSETAEDAQENAPESVETASQEPDEGKDITFADLGLSEKVLKAVLETGYTKPTPIQAKAIPVALKGRDVLGLAQTGTGKTASFTLPMIDILAQGRVRARMPRSLILCPTRELAMQVAENFENYGKYNKLSMALLIGGVSFADQEAKLMRGVDVLIATPGRLLDHFERGKVLLSGVQVLVIDEADRMLDMGFIPDIERIVSLTPFTRQTLFFSATMPEEINKLTQQFLQNPERIEVARQSSTAETVEQAVCIVKGEDKRKALRHLIRSNEVKNAIIFCNRKRDVSVLYRSLTNHEFSVAALHGDLDQRVRMQVLDQFRKGNIQLLVASDVAARGLDIPDVSHVFNFDVPFNSEDYVHRIGRTGRAGREGFAFMLSTPSERKNLGAIEELIKRPIKVMELDGLSLDGNSAEEDDEKPARGRRKRGGRDKSETRGRAKKEAKRETPKETETESKDDQPQSRPSPRPSETRSTDSNSKDKDQRGRRGGRRRRYEDDDDQPVVGMGDHVPAFLLRPVRPSATKPTTSNEADGADDSDEAEVPLARTG